MQISRFSQTPQLPGARSLPKGPELSGLKDSFSTQSLEGFAAGAFAGGALGATIGGAIGEPVGLIGGALCYGASTNFGGSQLSGAILGGILGAVGGPIAGAAVGGFVGATLGGGLGLLAR